MLFASPYRDYSSLSLSGVIVLIKWRSRCTSTSATQDVVTLQEMSKLFVIAIKCYLYAATNWALRGQAIKNDVQGIIHRQHMT